MPDVLMLFIIDDAILYQVVQDIIDVYVLSDWNIVTCHVLHLLVRDLVQVLPLEVSLPLSLVILEQLQLSLEQYIRSVWLNLLLSFWIKKANSNSHILNRFLTKGRS